MELWRGSRPKFHTKCTFGLLCGHFMRAPAAPKAVGSLLTLPFKTVLKSRLTTLEFCLQDCMHFDSSVSPLVAIAPKTVTRQPENCKRALVRVPALQKHHQNSTRRPPKRGMKGMKLWRETGKKSAKILGPRTLQGSTKTQEGQKRMAEVCLLRREARRLTKPPGTTRTRQEHDLHQNFSSLNFIEPSCSRRKIV